MRRTRGHIVRRKAKNELKEQLNREIHEHTFISIQRVRELVRAEVVSTILGLEEQSHDQAQNIADRAPRLFALLVLLGKESAIFKCLSNCISNDEKELLEIREPSHCQHCTHKDLHKKLIERQWRIPPILDSAQHQEYPSDFIAPFLSTDPHTGGAYGDVSKICIAHGHLPGSSQDQVFALKVVREDRRTSWESVEREARTLRARQNERIVPLLASFTAYESASSGTRIKSLYLVFPFSNMDMETWITSSCTPRNPQCLSTTDERLRFVCRTVSNLASGLSFLHRPINGKVTSHHDRKPKNILLFEDGWKLCDLGSGELVKIADGSGTEAYGTLAYQPPECWDSNGKRSRELLGRSFDIWSLGCITVELAILAVWGWTGELSRFRQERMLNESGRRYLSHIVDYHDDSFHNNMMVVGKWLQMLRQEGGNGTVSKLLDLAEEMLATDPLDRPLAWELEMDMFDIMNPLASEKERKNLYREFGHAPEPNSTELKHSPVRRAALQGNKVRLQRLFRLGWTTQGGILKEVRQCAEKDPALYNNIRISLAIEILRKLRIRKWHRAVTSMRLQLGSTTPMSDSLPNRESQPIDPLLEQDSTGKTLLHRLCEGSKYEAVADLLQRQQSGLLKARALMKRDELGKITIHYACGPYGEVRLLNLLLTKFSLGPNAFFHPTCMLDTRDSKGRTPLHIASMSGNMYAFSFLVRASRDRRRYQEIEDESGRTAIDYGQGV